MENQHPNNVSFLASLWIEIKMFFTLGFKPSFWDLPKESRNSVEHSYRTKLHSKRKLLFDEPSDLDILQRILDNEKSTIFEIDKFRKAKKKNEVSINDDSLKEELSKITSEYERKLRELIEKQKS